MIKFGAKNMVLTRANLKAVLFAIDAAEKRNEHGEKAQVVIIGPASTCDQDISRGSW
jgi:hypothetical protein